MPNDDPWFFQDDLEALGWQSTLEKSGIACSKQKSGEGWQLLPADLEAAEQLRSKVRERYVQRDMRSRKASLLRPSKALQITMALVLLLWIAVSYCGR